MAEKTCRFDRRFEQGPMPAGSTVNVLGGNHNFEVDRAGSQQIIKVMPDSAKMRGPSAGFSGRRSEGLPRDGYTQFIDFAPDCPPWTTSTRLPLREPRWVYSTSTP